MTSSGKIRLAAVSLACLGFGVGWYLLRPGGGPRNGPAGEAPRPAARPTQAVRHNERFPLRWIDGSGPPLQIALDEVCIRGADGLETLVKLDPPATRADFRSRLVALSGQGEVLPVAYPEDGERNDANRRLVTRRLRVKVPVSDAYRIAAEHGLEIAKRPDHAPDWVIMSAGDPLEALAAIDSVRASPAVGSADVLTARRRFPRLMPNDPLIGSQWHLKNAVTSPSISHVNVENAWKYGLAGGVKGTGIRIGIVDDGLQTAHPDFVGNIDTANGYDWNGDDPDPNPTLPTDRHGTACAGMAAARGNNGTGVSGVAPEATLVGLRLISGSFTDEDEEAASGWKNDIIEVKNNSWGPYDRDKRLEGPEPLMMQALETAAMEGRGGKGTIFVWAAGNGKAFEDNSNFDGYANSIYTIAVAAIERAGFASDYSEPGANILISAPAGDRDTIGSTTTDRTGADGYNTSSSDGNYHTAFDGTSAATPVVSGVVALMLQRNPSLGWRDVQEILFRSATKVVPSDPGWAVNGAGYSFHHQFGGGLVNASAAVDLAAGWTNLPAQTSYSVTQTGAIPIPENDTVGATRSFVFQQTNHRVENVTVALKAYHTARGNLAITLTSPSGVVSRLTEVRNDLVDDYQWTFSSVHHWGESALGTWTVKVADLSGSENTTGGNLDAVTVTLFGSPHAFPNQPPAISAATLDHSGQAFADQALAVSSVTAVDAEGSPVTLAYQWQSSTNGHDFTNAPGENAATLSPSPAHAGGLWRCIVTPSDGTDNGAGHATDAVNLLSRPQPFVRIGETYTFACGLVLPYAVNVPMFRLGAASDIPAGLLLDATTGVLGGMVDPGAEAGNHTVVVERYDSFGAVVSQTFVLKVFPADYAAWIGSFAVTSTAPSVDDDGDGIPNLVEYMLDLDPHRMEATQQLSIVNENGAISLTFRQSKLPADATLVPEWATTLDAAANWQSAGITTTILEEDAFSKLVRASLAIAPGDEKRFLRLKAALVDP